MRLQLGRGEPDVALEIAEGRGERVLRQDGPQELLGLPAVAVGHVERRAPVDVARLDVARDELRARVHADRAEDAPGDRVEERLRELGVGAVAEIALELGLHLLAQQSVGGRRTQHAAQLVHGPVDGARAELQPRQRIHLRAAPVARLEAQLGPPADVLELGLIGGERLPDGGRPPARQLGVRLVQHAGPLPMTKSECISPGPSGLSWAFSQRRSVHLTAERQSRRCDGDPAPCGASSGGELSPRAPHPGRHFN